MRTTQTEVATPMRAKPPRPTSAPPRIQGRRMPKREVVRSERRPTSGFAMRANSAPTPMIRPSCAVAASGAGDVLHLERHRHHHRREQGEVDAEVGEAQEREVAAGFTAGRAAVWSRPGPPGLRRSAAPWAARGPCVDSCVGRWLGPSLNPDHVVRGSYQLVGIRGRGDLPSGWNWSARAILSP